MMLRCPTLARALALTPHPHARTPTFTTTHLPAAPVGSRATFGGTLVAQALLAALSTVPQDFAPASVHCYFLRAGDPTRHITYTVDRLRDGRGHLHREVRAHQGSDLVFTSLVLFAAEQGRPGSLAHRKQRSGGLPPLGGYVPAAELFDREVLNEPRARSYYAGLPTARQRGGQRHLDALRESYVSQPLEYLFPPGFFAVNKGEAPPETTGYYVRVREGDAQASPQCHSDVNSDITASHSDITAGTADAAPSVTTPSVMPPTDPRFGYTAFAYLSDSHLLLCLPQLAGLPMFSHAFSVSLDHAIHFHAPPAPHARLYAELRRARSGAHRHLLHGEYFGADGAIVASVSQEGLVVYDDAQPSPAARL